MSSTRGPQWSYEVFLSFRGEDTRKNFVDHLYTALQAKGINTFRDDEKLARGSSISPALLTAIEKSRFAVVIFSKHYADSSWCLDEIAKIVDCRQNLGLTLLPVFYDVDPSEVRKQTGDFAGFFKRHEDSFKDDLERVQRWRNALREAASISGWDKEKTANGHESQCISLIVKKIFGDLARTASSSLSEDLVGVESHVDKLMSLLSLESDDVRIIGIWGMGGIGKTTIARALFDQIFSSFEGSSFLANVREVSKTSGLQHLEERLICDILMERNVNLAASSSLVSTRLRYKKALIVLDDVDKLEQIEKFAGKHDWFGAGSRIIITTRNRRLLLANEVDQVYDVNALDFDAAVRLFRKFAFKAGAQLASSYDKLVTHAVRYAKGLPLALRVLGSSLYGRDIYEWESALERLKDVPEDSVLEKLRVSFDGLNDIEKKIFLDIACFFKGKKKQSVIRKLDSFGFRAEIGVSELIQKSMIYVSDDKIQMHNLIQEMGWHVVRHAHPKEPWKHSRLWIPEEIENVLSQKLGTTAIEGIYLKYDKPESVSFSSKAFANMSNLRLLIIRNALAKREPELPSALRWLDWNKYPSNSLPAKFQGEKLEGIKLCNSPIEKVWDSKKSFDKLKHINLSYSKSLTNTPDFTGAPNVERLILNSCKCLAEVHPSVGKLKKLVVLNLGHCIKLRHLPKEIFLPSLEKLILWGCSKLEKFPEVVGEMRHLSELHLEGTAVKELHPSIIKLSGLTVINLSNCKSLVSLPNSICDIRGLRSLNLSGCLKLEKLPENIGSMRCLEELLVDGNSVTHPPSSLTNLTNLKVLSFSGCRGPAASQSKGSLFSVNLELPSLSSISDLLPLERLGLTSEASQDNLDVVRPSLSGLSSLTKLDLSYCDLLPKVAADISFLSSLEELNLSGNNFISFPARICDLPRLQTLKLESCSSLESLPDLPLSINVVIADECLALQSLGSLSIKHDKLWKVSLFNCFKLLEKKESSDAANLLLQSALQGHAVMNKRFSLLVPGRGIPKWFSHQSRGHSVSIHLPSQWHKNIIGFAVSAVFDRIVPKSKVGVTFKMVNQDHQEFVSSEEIDSVNKEEIIMDDASTGGHLWMGYISFSLFGRLFQQFRSDDWARIEGCLTIDVKEEEWLKPRSCGIRLVCQEDVKERLVDEYVRDELGNVTIRDGESSSSDIQESIATLTSGVGLMNWAFHPDEEEGLQLQNLRKAAAYKVQKTLWFDY